MKYTHHPVRHTLPSFLTVVMAFDTPCITSDGSNFYLTPCFTTRTPRWLDRKLFIRSEVRVTTEFRFRSPVGDNICITSNKEKIVSGPCKGQIVGLAPTVRVNLQQGLFRGLNNLFRVDSQYHKPFSFAAPAII